MLDKPIGCRWKEEEAEEGAEGEEEEEEVECSRLRRGGWYLNCDFTGQSVDQAQGATALGKWDLLDCG